MKVTPLLYSLIQIQVFIDGRQYFGLFTCWEGLHKLSTLVEMKERHHLHPHAPASRGEFFFKNAYEMSEQRK